ncbi:MAG: hypothetical protein PHN45_04365 [Methylococcales bacterium]|nr:hypothetical protein [Methylococcales bacterium]MDD5753969.1 hypothetical protein [Methylococcales bacterium]
MTEQIEVKPKNKGGRPKKDKKGEYLWIPAEYVTGVKAFFETMKVQAQQATKS